MTEFEIIRRYFDRGPVRRAELGIGDDAALLNMRGETLVTCTDMMVEGRHFFAGTDPASVGYKSLAVNLSDLAAMGAQPLAFTLAIALPNVDQSWLEKFSTGLFRAADDADCELIGGDTTRGPLVVCIAAHGAVPPGSAIRRDTAEPGDDVWVSGCLGAAAAVVHSRRGAGPALPSELVNRLDWPQARNTVGLALRHIASAAIDVSDGLIADLGHIAERSRAGMSIDASKIPVDPALKPLVSQTDALAFALNGGDDYEIAFTSAPENRVAIAGLADRLGVAMTRIGLVQAGQEICVTDGAGKPLRGIAGGYDHFA